MKCRTLAAVVVALVTLSCQGTIEQYEPEALKVTLSLDGSSVEVVDSKPADAAAAVPQQAAIDFAFFPDDGSPTVHGAVPDTRVVRSEYADVDGLPVSELGVSTFGLIEVEIPAIAGRLELSSEGVELGVVDFDPDAPATRQSALLRQSDIVGSPVKVVDHGSTASRADILFLPDGYTASEMGKFRQHVNTAVSQIRQYGGYSEYWNGFNVWRQDVKSRVRGAGSNGQPRDTAFETAFGHAGIDRCIFFGSSRGMQAARNIGEQVNADVIVVLVNSSTHGGCASGDMVVVARPQGFGQVVAHELGHALFDLRDEYETPRPDGSCSSGPNVAKSTSSLPWADMVNTSRLPTPGNASSSTIGAFEGAGYCSSGRYRPTKNCMMRSNGVGMCPVCRREMARTLGFNFSSGSSSSGSSSSSGGGPSAPRGLAPDGRSVTSTDVRLTWDRVSAASRYEIAIDRIVNGSWSTFGNTETTGTSARVTLRAEGGQYRWRVSSCNSSGCTASTYANFSFGSSSSSGQTGTGSTTSSGSTGSLATPGNLKPTDSTSTSDGTPSMSWSAVSGATHYRFKMVHRESEGNWPTYVSDQQVNSTRVSVALRVPERWYAFAARACNAAGCGEWTEYSRFYYRP